MEKNSKSGSPQRRSREWRVVVVLSVIIAVMLSVSFLVLSQQITSMASTSYNLAQNQADGVTQQVANLYDGYKKMGMILSVSQNLVEYADFDEASIVHHREEAHTLSKKMVQLINVYGQNINTVAAYFPSSDSVITMSRQLTSADKGLFFDSHPGLTPAMLEEAFSGSHQGMLLIRENQKHWLAQKATTSNGNLAYILLEYDLDEAVRQMIANTEGLLVLVGSESELLYTNVVTDPDPAFSELLADAEDGDLELGDGYITCCRETGVEDVSVIVGVEKRGIVSIRHQLFSLIPVTAITVAGSLAFLLYELRGQVFLPIEQLVTSRRKQDLGTRNALESISQDLSSIEDNRDQLLRERGSLIPVTMGRLLHRIVTEPEDSQNLNRASACLSMAGIPQEQSFATFSLALIEDGEQFFSNQTLDERGMSRMHFLLDNVLQDLLFERCPGCVIPVGSTHYEVLVLCPPETLDEVRSACKELLDFYEKRFAVVFSATNVDAGQGSQALVNIAIKQAKEVSFRSFWGEAATAEPAESTDTSAFYTYCNLLRHSISGLDLENYDKVWQNLDALLVKALPVDERNVKNTRYRMYAMTAFLITAMEEYLDGEREFIETSGFDARLYEAGNINDYRKELKAILREAVEYKASRQRDAFVSGRMEDVRRYLLEHYADNSISVAAVAEEFGISVSYLSRSFKEAFDVNLLEYIQRLRIAQAKKMLRTHTVQAVAKEVGFWDTQALARAFKKYEGMSPADYKRFLEKEQEWT